MNVKLPGDLVTLKSWSPHSSEYGATAIVNGILIESSLTQEKECKGWLVFSKGALEFFSSIYWKCEKLNENKKW